MVVFEDGLAAKGQYRRFRLRDVPGNDDFAAMEEVLTRRLRNYLEDRAKPVAERGRFQYPPQLLMVDGGKGQLGVALRVVRELGLDDEIPVCALAKQFEEIYVPGRSDPIRLPRQSEALYLLQRLRDESHRFAITYQRQLRGKRMTKGFLDDIPGLGPDPAQAAGQGAGRGRAGAPGQLRAVGRPALAARGRGPGHRRQEPGPRPRPATGAGSPPVPESTREPVEADLGGRGRSRAEPRARSSTTGRARRPGVDLEDPELEDVALAGSEERWHEVAVRSALRG